MFVFNSSKKDVANQDHTGSSEQKYLRNIWEGGESWRGLVQLDLRYFLNAWQGNLYIYVRSWGRASKSPADEGEETPTYGNIHKAGLILSRDDILDKSSIVKGAYSLT